MLNSVVADYVSSSKLGQLRNVRCFKVNKSPLGIRLTHLLYLQGAIRSYKVEDKAILVYFKFVRGRHIVSKMDLVSRPGRRERWRLNRLALNFNLRNFSGFYVISTQYGLAASDDCLLRLHAAGEILFYVEF